MWFNPGELSKNKTTPPANFANPANYELENSKTAPEISKLAELATPLDSEINNDELKAATLSVADQQKILAWLAFIGETDQETIDETINRCKADKETLAYFLHRADEVPNQQEAITCRSCQHFKSYNKHGGGAGNCKAGIQSLGTCCWADTAQQCDKHQLA